VRKTKVPVWKSADGGYFIADEATGKHESSSRSPSP
jgi:hypothetical protein